MVARIAPIDAAHLGSVMAVQARAYGAQLLEAPEVLGSKLRAPGGACWGAFAPEGTGADAASPGRLCAYAISHAVPAGAALALNKVLAEEEARPAPGAWLYVHDIAIDPAWAGTGSAARLLAEVLNAGRRLGLHRAMLVAVQGADAYWARHGFIAGQAPMPLRGFGDGAVWMAREV